MLAITHTLCSFGSCDALSKRFLFDCSRFGVFVRRNATISIRDETRLPSYGGETDISSHSPADPPAQDLTPFPETRPLSRYQRSTSKRGDRDGIFTAGPPSKNLHPNFDPRYRKARAVAAAWHRHFKVLSEPFSVALLQQAPSSKVVREILRAQIARAQTTKDILRVVAVAVQRPRFFHDLSAAQITLLCNLYRMRARETDVRIFSVIRIVHKRLKMIDVHFCRESLSIGLMFAARARSLDGMKLFLRELRERGYSINAHVFTSIIAKFSIGRKGFGKLRNGSWKREELMQVLFGFPDVPQDQPPFHLATFLKRNRWPFISGWTAVLVYVQARDELEKEWELWKTSPLRLSSTSSTGSGAKVLGAKLRGDKWFFHQFIFAGDPQKAWSIFHECNMRLEDLGPNPARELLNSVHQAHQWPGGALEALGQKLDGDIAVIKTRLTELEEIRSSRIIE